MIINFNFTRQNQWCQIEYFNSRGLVVKLYQLQDLNKFLLDEKSFLDHESLPSYIDLHWLSVTQDFYNAMNPNEFKSNNQVQQNRKI